MCIMKVKAPLSQVACCCCENSDFLNTFDHTETQCMRSSYSQMSKRPERTQDAAGVIFSDSFHCRCLSQTAPCCRGVQQYIDTCTSGLCLFCLIIGLWSDKMLFDSLRARCSLTVSWHEFCHCFSHFPVPTVF